MPSKMLLVINGSPHKTGHTYQVLKAVVESEAEPRGLTPVWVDLDPTLPGCQDCGACSVHCPQMQDQTQEIIEKIRLADVVLFGSPVYLDMPTAQMVALLTRLNCMAEPTKREFFQGKDAWIATASWCSGTKAAASIMRGALEMLGFNIPARSSWEHSAVWKDSKVRGGNRQPGAFIR